MKPWRTILSWDVVDDALSPPGPLDLNLGLPNTLVYLEGGDRMAAYNHLTDAYLERIRQYAKATGHVGYLEGTRRRYDGGTDHVVCYFLAQPSDTEIMRRRGNGFAGARWQPIGN